MKQWKIGIVEDTSKPMLGLHGLHVAFNGLPNAQVVGFVDSKPDNIQQRMAACHARKHYTSLTQMLDHESLDIVVICSRHPSDHWPMIKQIAERGIHIYCDKPMTLSLTQANQAIALTQKNNVKMSLAHPVRNALAFRTMKAMIDAGEIGKPLTAYGRGKCDHRGGAEDLIVLGTHILDWQNYLFGEPQSVWANVTQDGQPITNQTRIQTIEPLGPLAGDSVMACFQYASGIRGIFESQRGLLDIPSGYIHMGLTVVGSKGTLSLRFNDSLNPVYDLRISRLHAPPEDAAEYVPIDLKETRQIPNAKPLDESLCGTRNIPREPFFLHANRYAAWDLIQAIEENRPTHCNPQHARTALEMIYGIFASHLTGRQITFPLSVDDSHCESVLDNAIIDSYLKS
jgi:predicted dehydrogenase